MAQRSFTKLAPSYPIRFAIYGPYRPRRVPRRFALRPMVLMAMLVMGGVAAWLAL